MHTINMLSKADRVKGQGVLSAYLEQVELVKTQLQNDFTCYQNRLKLCDIMHYHTINPEFFLTLPLAKAFGTTVGYVHFLPETLENSIHLPSLAKKIFYRYVIRFYKSMDYLVTVNPTFIPRLAAYGVDPGRVTYIPNFVSDRAFHPLDATEKRRLRARYQLPDDRFVVLCAGQLQRRKGFFDYLALAERLPEVTFLWAGAFSFGKISDGYQEIEEVLRHPPKNFRLLGLVPREEMNGLYNLSDLMLLPSYEELFPMTVLEAMNCGTPILLRDLDIYPDILFDFYLKGGSNEEFAQTIRRLRTDGDFLAQAREKSYRGHQFYSREHVTTMWREFYHGLLTQPKQRRRLAAPRAFGKLLPFGKLGK